MEQVDSTVLVPCAGIVTCVECSPFDHCSSLLCYVSHVNSDTGLSTHNITIAKIHPKREENKILEILKEYQQDRPVTCLAWSPRTYIESLPYEVVLCAGTIDGQVSLITTDLRQSNEMQILGNHDKPINSAAFDNDTGELLATVGDDCRCHVWNTLSGDRHCTFPLKSAGADVQFNYHDNTKLVVAEKCGIIRFYDMKSSSAFMSVETGKSAVLKCIDWSIDDMAKLDALCGSQLLSFNTTISCLPVSAMTVSKPDDVLKYGRRLRVSKMNSDFIAVSCGKGSDVTIVDRRSSDSEQGSQTISRHLGSGFSWLRDQPYLICGGDSALIMKSLVTS